MSAAVRRASGADLADVVRLRALGRAGGDEPGGAPVDGGADLGAALAGSDAVAVFVADDHAGRPVCVAFGAAHDALPSAGVPGGRVGHVFDVVTEPAHRGRGLASATVTALLEWFGQVGVTRVELRSSGEGERLYERLGFVRSGASDYVLELTSGATTARRP